MNIRLYLPALAFVLCSGCATRLQRSTDVARTGQPVPYFSLTLSDSSRVTPDSLLGAPALLIFFNTRCGACRQELPQLQKLYGRIPLTVPSGDSGKPMGSLFRMPHKLAAKYTTVLPYATFRAFTSLMPKDTLAAYSVHPPAMARYAEPGKS